MPITAPNSPSASVSGLSHHNEVPGIDRLSAPTRPSSIWDLANRDEVKRREVATLSTHLVAACGEIPRAFGVAAFSLVFAYAGQKTILSLMQNQNPKSILVIGGGAGDAASGVAKEFARAFLANCFPTLRVPNHVQGGRWPLTKQAGTTLVLNGVAEGLFHFLAGLANSFGISKEMSYYGVDHIADKSEAYLKILNHINPNEMWSPLGVKAGSEFIKDVVNVLGIALAFKLNHAEHDFRMCRKFNMRKVINTALLNSAARLVVAVCSGAWVNANNNASQTAFMFTGARNASLPAVFNFIRVVSMGIVLAAFMDSSRTRASPIDPENRIGEVDDDGGNALNVLLTAEQAEASDPAVAPILSQRVADELRQLEDWPALEPAVEEKKPALPDANAGRASSSRQDIEAGNPARVEASLQPKDVTMHEPVTEESMSAPPDSTTTTNRSRAASAPPSRREQSDGNVNSGRARSKSIG